MNFSVLRFDSIESTNTEALKQARHGANEGLCVIARRQTAGRGRQGRTWISPPDAGLYLSIVLRPRIDPKRLPLLTLAAAIAVYDTLTTLGVKPDIKWPNDVLVNDRKISGILTETAETEQGLAIIVGIGINLSVESGPPELSASATSIESELGRSVPLSEIEQSLLEQFDKWYGTICESGPWNIIVEWTARSSYAHGKRIRAATSNATITGVTDGLEPDGALRILSTDGGLSVVHAGDIERLRTDEQFD